MPGQGQFQVYPEVHRVIRYFPVYFYFLCMGLKGDAIAPSDHVY